MTLTKKLTLWLFLALANPAAALDACDDLWFTRNLIFDRAGYCFGSALGQAVFGNDGCTTKTPQLSHEDKGIIERACAFEDQLACNVDTTRQSLDVDLIAVRKAMTDLPITDGLESACIGWKGPETPLFQAQTSTSDITGYARSGDTILWLHESVGSWSFITVSLDGVPQTAGWVQIELTEGSCTFMAG
jgi:hypothetical protein